MEKGGKKGKAKPGCLLGHGDLWGGGTVKWAFQVQANAPMPAPRAEVMPRPGRLGRIAEELRADPLDVWS